MRSDAISCFNIAMLKSWGVAVRRVMGSPLQPCPLSRRGFGSLKMTVALDVEN